MQAQPECRKSKRFSHKCIIRLGDDRTLPPYYAVSNNLSEKGMCFKSLSEMHPGEQILFKIDDYTSSRDQVPAEVVWCKKIENTATFCFGVGVKFMQPVNEPALAGALPSHSANEATR